MPRTVTSCRRDARPGPAEGLAPAAVAWRVGWSGPGRAAVLALAVGPSVVADRIGPDRVGSRGAAAVRGGVARPADGVRPRPRPLGIPLEFQRTHKISVPVRIRYAKRERCSGLSSAWMRPSARTTASRSLRALSSRSSAAVSALA
jgi:hypothetical protein